MPSGKLNRKTRYLQVALNSTLEEAREIIAVLPVSERIIIEAGTPLIKHYGTEGIRMIHSWWQTRIFGGMLAPTLIEKLELGAIFKLILNQKASRTKETQKPTTYASHTPATPTSKPLSQAPLCPYVVADLKTFDRGATEVDLAADAGASGAIASASAPTETLNVFIKRCKERGLDSMVDTMNVEFPLSILRKLKELPDVVVLHRGVDEEAFNREKQLPYHEIHRIKGNYNIFLSMAGGDSIREVQRAVFNDIDIVIVWKSFFQHSSETGKLAEEFLHEIK